MSDSRKKTVRQVMEHALAVLRASNIRGMEKLPAEVPAEVPEACVKSSLLSFEITRTFLVRAGIAVSFSLVDSGERIAPKVRVSMPAINEDALSVAAFSALLQEVSAIAVTLQVELNEFEVMFK
jgi:hypothetical protein